MRRSRRGRKLTAAVAAEAIEASAGLRPDQAITEAAVGRVLPTPIRRRAGAPVGRSQDRGFAKRAFGYASAQVGGLVSRLFRPAQRPNPVEIATEKPPTIAATSRQRGPSSRSAIAPLPDAPSETRGQFTSGPSARRNADRSSAPPPGPPGPGSPLELFEGIRADGFISPAGIGRCAARWTRRGEVAERPAPTR